ncbi:hypothetical protein VNO77_43610 [Canavalia gladiata]|uniref:F-box domain-containing protein n=1 Tax=Canavalia gladiata TaxID=3824 RepID=A0AAN9JUE5_CANGL
MWRCCIRKNDAEEEKNRAGPNWLELPRDVTEKILNQLNAIEILVSVRCVCSLWWNMCKEPLMWRTIGISNLDALQNYHTDQIENMCFRAIDLSRGHLQHFNIEDIASDSLLKYVANSTSQLRRMRLAFCCDISDEGLREIANKLSLLEELDICFTSLSKQSLEAIGRCCPNLTTLNFNTNLLYIFNSMHDNDGDAFAIAKTMPNLRHLQLLGNLLSNDGLLAILDGCNHLESLDLRVGTVICEFISSEQASDTCLWHTDVTAKILNNLSTIEIVMSARKVCSLWWNICKDPIMRRTIHITKSRASPNADLVRDSGRRQVSDGKRYRGTNRKREFSSRVELGGVKGTKGRISATGDQPLATEICSLKALNKDIGNWNRKISHKEGLNTCYKSYERRSSRQLSEAGATALSTASASASIK